MELIKSIVAFAFVLIPSVVSAQTNFELSDFTKTFRPAKVKASANSVEVKMGDVDGNGKLTINDVNELTKALLQSGYTLNNPLAADMSGNGTVDITDVTLLIDELLHPSTGQLNGYEYVDLGLSVRWATCNIGACSPEEYGEYYTWGDISTQSSYLWYYYKYNTEGYYDSKGCKKYQVADGKTTAVWYSNGSFIGDNKSTLDSTDDAATQSWGKGWRMPTPDEVNDLLTKCNWTWISDNTRKGYKVERNGRSIFIPAAGCRYSTACYGKDSYGYYWTNSLVDGYTMYARSLYLTPSDHKLGFDERNYGLTIRPVCAK